MCWNQRFIYISRWRETSYCGKEPLNLQLTPRNPNVRYRLHKISQLVPMIRTRPVNSRNIERILCNIILHLKPGSSGWYSQALRSTLLNAVLFSCMCAAYLAYLIRLSFKYAYFKTGPFTMSKAMWNYITLELICAFHSSTHRRSIWRDICILLSSKIRTEFNTKGFCHTLWINSAFIFFFIILMLEIIDLGIYYTIWNTVVT
jgi:hypothetical protein